VLRLRGTRRPTPYYYLFVALALVAMGVDTFKWELDIDE
jgi:hypothetical protein